MNDSLKQFLLLVTIVVTLATFETLLTGCGAKKRNLIAADPAVEKTEKRASDSDTSDQNVYTEKAPPKARSSKKAKEKFPFKLKNFKVTKTYVNLNETSETKHLKVSVDIDDSNDTTKKVNLEGDLNKYNEAKLTPTTDNKTEDGDKEENPALKGFARCIDENCKTVVVDYFAKQENQIVKVEYEHKLNDKKSNEGSDTKADSKQEIQDDFEPEIANNKDSNAHFTPNSDLFSAGVVMYML
jgi:hypothetical protein